MALLASSLLFPIFWYGWMFDSGGNANYFYAVTLLYGTAQCLVLNDHIRAHFLLLNHSALQRLPNEKLKRL